MKVFRFICFCVALGSMWSVYSRPEVRQAIMMSFQEDQEAYMREQAEKIAQEYADEYGYEYDADYDDYERDDDRDYDRDYERDDRDYDDY